jgi:hypothetical protein
MSTQQTLSKRRPRMRWQCLTAVVALGIIVTGGLFFLNKVTLGIYKRFVQPTKSKLIETGYPERPELRINPSASAGSFQFGSLEFPLLDQSTQGMCLADYGGYRMMAGGVEFWLERNDYKYFLPIEMDKPLLNFAGTVIKLYPFNRHAPDIAREVAHNSQVAFPLYTPVDNLLKLYGSLDYAIVIPAAAYSTDDSFFASMEGPGMFVLMQGMKRKEHSAVMVVLVVREDRLEHYLLALVSKEQGYRDAYAALLKGLRIADTPHAIPSGLPPCPPKAN